MIIGDDFGGRKRCDEVVFDTVLVGEDPAIAAFELESARRTLLISHRDGPAEGWPHVAIARIEGIVDFAGEIVIAALVEPAGMIAPDQGLLRLLRIGDVRIERVSRRRKEVGAVTAHLVGVDNDDRVPFKDAGDTAARFGLSQSEPVAVHVKQVVVEAAGGPGFVMLGAGTVGEGFEAARRFKRMNEAGAPIRVLHRVNDDDGFAEDLVHNGIAAGSEQVIGERETGIGAGNLIAVDAIGEPDDCRRARQNVGAVLSGELST